MIKQNSISINNVTLMRAHFSFLKIHGISHAKVFALSLSICEHITHGYLFVFVCVTEASHARCSLFKYDYRCAGCCVCFVYVFLINSTALRARVRSLIYSMCVYTIFALDLALAFGLGLGLGFALFIRFGFFGFKINDWPYYMYNLVNAMKMLKEKSQAHTRHIHSGLLFVCMWKNDDDDRENDENDEAVFIFGYKI